ncbi:MAG: hypothetical protein JKY49_03480 [Cohaesibacteraceae bacterium]|nr:hypothetical protein [Cohaesibacteraceae bacterium]
MKNTLSSRIAERLATLGLNPTSASRLVGKTRDLIRKPLDGATDNPTAKNLQLIARALETTPDWLLDGTGEEYSPRSNARPAPDVDVSFMDESSMSSSRTTPILGSAAGSLSTGAIELGDSNAGFAIDLPQLRGIPGVYCLYVIGDSMAPGLRAGQLVYINPHLPPAKDDVVVVQLNVPGEATCEAFIKRFVKVTKEQVAVEQDNPKQSIHYSQYTGDDDEAFVKAVHKVVAYWTV